MFTAKEVVAMLASMPLVRSSYSGLHEFKTNATTIMIERSISPPSAQQGLGDDAAA
jgi:hypothetical protein